MNHLPPRVERNALLPFVQARLCELVFLADRIRHVPATAIDDNQKGIRDRANREQGENCARVLSTHRATQSDLSQGPFFRWAQEEEFN